MILGKPVLGLPARTGTPHRRAPAVAKSAGACAAAAAGSQPGGGRTSAAVSVPPWSGDGAETYSRDPMDREAARTYQYGLDNGARNWAAPLPGLVREAQDNTDPRQREQARASIEKSSAGPEQTPAMSARMLTWGAGPGGGPEWQPLTQPTGRGRGFAVPGTAGR